MCICLNVSHSKCSNHPALEQQETLLHTLWYSLLGSYCMYVFLHLFSIRCVIDCRASQHSSFFVPSRDLIMNEMPSTVIVQIFIELKIPNSTTAFLSKPKEEIFYILKLLQCRMALIKYVFNAS